MSERNLTLMKGERIMSSVNNIERLKGEIIFVSPFHYDLVRLAEQRKEKPLTCEINKGNKWEIFALDASGVTPFVMNFKSHRIGIIISPYERKAFLLCSTIDYKDIFNLCNEGLLEKIRYGIISGGSYGDIHNDGYKKLAVWNFMTYKIVYKE